MQAVPGRQNLVCKAWTRERSATRRYNQLYPSGIVGPLVRTGRIWVVYHHTILPLDSRCVD